MTVTLGLTGGIASGKSTVAQMLVKMGASLIDADLGARLVVAPGSAGLAAVVAHFGEQMLRPDGTLNRALMGQLIFQRPKQKAALEAILHPLILEWMQQLLQEYQTQEVPMVVLDIPLLFETRVGLELCDYTALVWVPQEVQLERLMARNQYSQQEALARIQAQMPVEEKRALADFCIDNSGTLAATQDQVAQLWQQLCKSNAPADESDS